MKRKDIWSSIEFEPRFHSLTIVPEQKKVIKFNIKENVFYFNLNPYGESSYRRIRAIRNNGGINKLQIETEDEKSMNILSKNNIENILINILLDLYHSIFLVSKLDKDHIQLTFLNNVLYRLEISKYDKDEVVSNLVLMFENQYIYIYFNGPKILVEKVEIIDDKLIIKTPFNIFTYLLNSQPVICNYLKLLIKESTDMNQVQTMVSNDQKNELPILQSNSISNYYWQIQYNSYFEYMFFSLNKTVFFYLKKEKMLLFSSGELGLIEFKIIKVLNFDNKENIFIELEGGKTYNILIHYDIDKIIYRFLESIKKESIKKESNHFNTFAFFILNGKITQFRIAKINKDAQTILESFQLFTNNAILTSKINETSGIEISKIEITNNGIELETKEHVIKLDMMLCEMLSNFMKDIINEGLENV